MKDNRNYFFNLYKSFKDSVVTVPEVSLGNPIELPVLLKKLGWRIAGSCFPSMTKFNARLRQLHNFGQHILRMRKHHGDMFVVKYLKAAQLAISKAVAGNPFHSLRELEPDLNLPRLTTSGLPPVIPLGDRRRILSGHPSTIRWWLTLFSLYRIMKVAGRVKLSTISNPYSGSTSFLENACSDLGVLSLRFKHRFSWKPSIPEVGLLFLESSSPSFSVSWLGFVYDVQSLVYHGLDLPLLTIMRKFWGSDSRMEEIWNSFRDLHRARDQASLPISIPGFKDRQKDTLVVLPDGIRKYPIGQLALKTEAAGKVRVFAMVDVWTQSVLKPLHDSISSILKSLPNDGTFNQRAAVTRCFSKAESAGLSYGYDLSAATDRLPIVLQVAVLSPLFGREVAEAWRQLLVSREYILKDQSVGEDAKYETHTYAVGQPMGALSSFNMLALTHHLIVQWSAQKAGLSRPGTWWEGYELLGDDIVIFDALVADQYLHFMKGIGMEVNVKKSVVAKNNSFEFAKVTGHNGVDVSALSWKMFISQNSFFGRANIAFNLLKRGIGRPGTKWFRNILRHRRYTQGDFNISLVAVFSMFAGSAYFTLPEFLRGMMAMKEPMAKPFIQVRDKLRVSYILNIMSQALKGLPLGIDKGPSSEASWRHMWPFLKAHKFKVIKKTWDQYFPELKVTKAYIADLADQVCDMLVDGFVTAPADTPSGVNRITECNDEVWWSIHDLCENEFLPYRRKLDHIGQQAIDEISFDDLEKGDRLCGSLTGVLLLPQRAQHKIMNGADPERIFTQSVDALSWVAAARRDQIRKTPMHWYSTTWDIWYY